MSEARSITEPEWSEYFQAVLKKPLHPTFALLDPFLPPAGEALDLGCGVGHGVLHLLEEGLRVTAVDQSSEALEIVQSRLPEGANAVLIQSTFQDLDLEALARPIGGFDVVVAGFSLFFLPDNGFAEFWPRLVAALKPGGVFMGQLLGKRDEWNDRRYVLFDRDGVERLLAPFETLYFEEAERDGETAVGTPKHWHVFHIVARKR